MDLASTKSTFRNVKRRPAHKWWIQAYFDFLPLQKWGKKMQNKRKSAHKILQKNANSKNVRTLRLKQILKKRA